MKNKYLAGLVGLLFVLTRVYIWVAKPVGFTQITDVYMPYAHLWASGMKPYLEQWYEYPPATIPLFYLPHLVDMTTLKQPLHLDYGIAYRGILLLIDMGLFALIILSLKKFKVKPSVFAGALIYYCLATAKAHDFIYDSMDLVFIGAVIIGIMAPLLIKGVRGQIVEWLAFFLGIALKLINGPLGLVYAVFEKKGLKKLVLIVALTGMAVWILPLVMYRSSMRVMLVYHTNRGLQVESVPAQIVALVNRFTNTESYNNDYKSVNIDGPISQKVKQVDDRLFFPVLLLYVLWAARIAWKSKLNQQTELRLMMTIGFFLCFMLFGKVLSTPYHLWLIPLIALIPFKSLKQQLSFTLPSLFMVVISMTLIPNLPIGIFNVHLLIGVTRSMIIAYLLWKTIRIINFRKAL
jgi:hypothetical protein